MRYKMLAGKRTSVIALGGALFGSSLSRELSYEILDAYRALGGNFIDTARIYGDIPGGRLGLSEQVIGQWMQDRGAREEITLGTKGGHPDIRSMHVGRLDAGSLESDLRQSLEALRTDCVDIYYLHRDDTSLSVGSILDTLNRFVADGRVRYLGASNWTAARLREAERYAAEHHMAGFCADQPQFSLARQAAVWDDTTVQMDAGHWAFHRNTGMPCVCYSAQAHGFFTKLRERGEGALDGRMRRQFLSPENADTYERLLRLSRETGHSVHALSLAYLTSQPFDTFAICGTSGTGQVEALREAADLKLSDGQVRFLRAF